MSYIYICITYIIYIYISCVTFLRDPPRCFVCEVTTASLGSAAILSAQSCAAAAASFHGSRTNVPPICTISAGWGSLMLFLYMHVCIYIYIHICIYIYTYIYIYTCVYRCNDVRNQSTIYISMYIYLYIRTHIIPLRLDIPQKRW